MKVSQELRIALPAEVRSLCWDGDSLVDWVSGGNRLGLDGSFTYSDFRLAYSRFDSAVASPDGRSVVVYERRGTKGVLLHDGRILREIGRSFYHAEKYDYPVALVRRPGDRLLLVHCPDEYNRLEIEDYFTGERLSHRRSESPDVFHARLMSSPDGRFLLAEGWVWHPVDVVQRFNLDAALVDPTVLDKTEGNELVEPGASEVANAAFGLDGEILLTAATSRSAPEGKGYRWWMESDTLARIAPTTGEVLHAVRPEALLGQMMPVGHTHVVGFCGNPTLVELATGRVVQSWPDLDTGARLGSARGPEDALPPLALDPKRKRFAVANGTEVTVVTLAE